MYIILLASVIARGPYYIIVHIGLQKTSKEPATFPVYSKYRWHWWIHVCFHYRISEEQGSHDEIEERYQDSLTTIAVTVCIKQISTARTVISYSWIIHL